MILPWPVNYYLTFVYTKYDQIALMYENGTDAALKNSDRSGFRVSSIQAARASMGSCRPRSMPLKANGSSRSAR